MNIATFDLETDPFLYNRVPQVVCGGLYMSDGYQQYWGDKTIEYLVEDLKDFDGIAYAHNGGKFDFHYFLKYINKENIRIINGRIAEMRIGKCLVRDSYLILPVPLKLIQKDDFDYTKLEKENREKYKKEILLYLKHDCEYLYNAVIKFHENFGNKFTVASAAFSQLKKMTTAKIQKCNRAHDEKFRKFYFGGRCQAFKTGVFKKDLILIDINSAYPFAMQHNHPNGYKYEIFDSLNDLKDNQIKCCFIELECYSFGAFPLKTDTGLSFPCGKYHFNVTGHEYLIALKHNLISDIKIITVYKPSYTLNFSDFVSHYYKAKSESKKNGDKLKELLSKLMLNSAYGKFAITPDNYHEWKLGDIGEDINETNEDDEEYEQYGKLGQNHWLWRRSLSNTQDYIFNDVATAASITGYVRAYLLDALNRVTEPLYCDTDSILCENADAIELDNFKIGAWDKDKIIKEAYIAGKKLYTLKYDDDTYKTASKGVRANANDIIKICEENKIVEIEQIAPIFSVNREVSFQTRKIRKIKKINEKNKNKKFKEIIKNTCVEKN